MSESKCANCKHCVYTNEEYNRNHTGFYYCLRTYSLEDGDDYDCKTTADDTCAAWEGKEMSDPKTLEEALQIISDRDKEILRLRNWLLDISFYSFDYDGYNSGDKLKMVIDNVDKMIGRALAGEPNSEVILALMEEKNNDRT